MCVSYQFWPVAGHPVLDLCNTRSWRRDPRRDIERIASPAEFVRWYRTAVGEDDGAQLGRQVADDPRSAEADLRVVHCLRDTVINWLDAHVEGNADRDAAAVFERHWRAVIDRATLPGNLPLRWDVGGGEAIRGASDRLTLAATELLRGSELGLVRRCAQPDCGWFFLDRTRNHSRRWCIADDCGNLARVRAYAARKRQDRLAH